MHHQPAGDLAHPRPGHVALGPGRCSRNCTVRAHTSQQEPHGALAEYSRDCLKALRAGNRHPPTTSACRARCSSFARRSSSTAPAADIAILQRYGVACQLLDRDGCLRHEPALARVRDKFVGGLRLPGDETGDCFSSRRTCADSRRRWACEFRFGVDIQRLRRVERIDAACTPTPGRLRPTTTARAGQLFDALLAPLGLRHPGLPGQGLLDHRADHRRVRRARVDRDGRDPQGRGHAPGRSHPRRRHGASCRATTWKLGDAPPATRWTIVTDLFPRGGDARRPSSGRPAPDDARRHAPHRAHAAREPVLATGHGTLGWTMAAGTGQVRPTGWGKGSLRSTRKGCR